MMVRNEFGPGSAPSEPGPRAALAVNPLYSMMRSERVGLDVIML